MTPARATMIGMLAIGLWSVLAVLTVASGTMPPFQLTALTFAIGALAGFILLAVQKRLARAFAAPRAAWLHGIGGLFGYHALYFFALRAAPPAEAGLINYLWPLLIVLLSSLLPGERLRVYHVIGALMGLAGTVILIFGRGNVAFALDYWPGFLAAFIAAFIWSTYSVTSRFFRDVPTETVATFCAGTALLSLLCHVVFETTLWPAQIWQWLAIVALGLGPVGLAFYVWQVGMKWGDVRVIGALSYATPLLSTAWLIVAGMARFSPSLIIAALLIAGGGLIASRDMLTRRAPSPP